MCRPAVFPERIYLSAVSLLGGFIVARFPILAYVYQKTVNFGRIFRSCQNPFFAAEPVNVFLTAICIARSFPADTMVVRGDRTGFLSAARRNLWNLYAYRPRFDSTASAGENNSDERDPNDREAAETIPDTSGKISVGKNRNRGYVIPKYGFCSSI